MRIKVIRIFALCESTYYIISFLLENRSTKQRKDNCVILLASRDPSYNDVLADICMQNQQHDSIIIN